MNLSAYEASSQHVQLDLHSQAPTVPLVRGLGPKGQVSVDMLALGVRMPLMQETSLLLAACVYAKPDVSVSLGRAGPVRLLRLWLAARQGNVSSRIFPLEGV